MVNLLLLYFKSKKLNKSQTRDTNLSSRVKNEHGADYSQTDVTGQRSSRERSHMTETALLRNLTYIKNYKNSVI